MQFFIDIIKLDKCKSGDFLKSIIDKNIVYILLDTLRKWLIFSLTPLFIILLKIISC